jgi:hypothetical protein
MVFSKDYEILDKEYNNLIKRSEWVDRGLHRINGRVNRMWENIDSTSPANMRNALYELQGLIHQLTIKDHDLSWTGQNEVGRV